MCVCKFCAKLCKNQNSLRNHERMCKSNPDRQNSSEWNNKNGNLGKSNQYVKAKENGVICNVPEHVIQKLTEANASRTKEWHAENGKRISATINEKVKAGTWHTSLAKKMHISYNGIGLHGSWELRYAKFLDSKNIQWLRNKESFVYEFEGKVRRYTPDFYLPETCEYIEIKGYKTPKDDAKWSYFPSEKKLKVLLRHDLKILGII